MFEQCFYKKFVSAAFCIFFLAFLDFLIWSLPSCVWLLINNSNLVQRPFYERWKMLEKEVIEPRNQERHSIYQSRNPYYRYDLEPFRACISSLNLLVEYFELHFIFPPLMAYYWCLKCCLGEEERFLVAFYCHKAFKGIH